MRRLAASILVCALAPALGGCVAAVAMSAANLAADAARGTPVANAALQPQARDSCTARAGQYGAVHVIDVQQARPDKIIVWGTVEDGTAKRSFECDFGTSITAFKLREIKPAS